ncbi:MAG TPA: isoaspartyl peptidase/L-asparaginase [Bacteroidales bacterium]|nr:isoaspartyl peptidase/L-asparaginase [Bacteroidales bacterium]HOU98389.1 isoaspartyl peptidase/L-asparaginase [Bacteroidales bacterium]
MRLRLLCLILFGLHSCISYTQRYALVIHGGAGNITPSNLKNPQAYSDALDSALNIGSDILKRGGSSLDAVEQVIRFFEDNPLFNAGRGAVLTENGKAELDASIMDGKSLLAGAVAGVTTIKNPISAARKVMEKTPHVLLMGEGAAVFAKEQQLELVPNEYFITPESKERFEKAKSMDKHGTVGCVALDMNGNLAAGTSTGGMMLKKYGRVGDSPIIGAGTYANNQTCAVSCTGHGEYFIRNAVAFHVHALMLYKKLTLRQSLQFVVDSVLTPQNGTGGLIAVDKKGNVAWYFNTAGMFRASMDSNGIKKIEMYSK